VEEAGLDKMLPREIEERLAKVIRREVMRTD